MSMPLPVRAKTQLLPVHNRLPSPTGPNVAIGRLVSSQVVAPDQNIVPSLQFLQTDSAIQSQVDNRMVEINQLGDQRLHPGKLVSQRGVVWCGGGGGPPVPIKRLVPWPQNYVLVGKYRRRLTYDELSPTHFIAGCIKGTFDLPQKDREVKLIYLANLLEDASDFGMENAKACHAMVLTEMEQGKCEWMNREALDRFRRCHAQRHDPPTKVNVQMKQKSNNNQSGNRN